MAAPASASASGDTTVVAWGSPGFGETDVPTGLSGNSADMVVNGHFERPVDASATVPMAWTSGAWQPTAIFSCPDSVAHRGRRSVSIDAPQPNDAWWSQTVAVQPHTLYRLSGWIKTANVAHSTEIVDAGANLGFLGTWEHSPGVFGTAGWTNVWVSINSGDSDELTVAARLGYWAGTTSGTAWFDDIRLERVKSLG
jgi:alpha-N-arabinofuranosidase